MLNDDAAQPGHLSAPNLPTRLCRAPSPPSDVCRMNEAKYSSLNTRPARSITGFLRQVITTYKHALVLRRWFVAESDTAANFLSKRIFKL